MIYLNENFTLDRKIETKGFFYGLGCYEIIKGKKEKILFVDEHIENIEKNMKKLDIYRKIDFKSILYEFIRLKHIEEKSFIAFILVNDKDVYIDLNENININSKKYYDIGSIKSIYHNELSNINSLNRISNLFAEKEIKEKNYDEGIFLNRQNFVTNCIKNNIFFIQDNIIKTPSKSLNVINDIIGIKIEEIIKKIDLKIEYGNYTIDDLIKAESVFLTSVYNDEGIIEVNSINDNKKNINNLIVGKLKKEYLKKCENML